MAHSILGDDTVRSKIMDANIESILCGMLCSLRIGATKLSAPTTALPETATVAPLEMRKKYLQLFGDEDPFFGQLHHGLDEKPDHWVFRSFFSDPLVRNGVYLETGFPPPKFLFLSNDCCRRDGWGPVLQHIIFSQTSGLERSSH